MQSMESALINRMLELRVKDLAARPADRTLEEKRRLLRQSLGLDPLPPRTPLNAEVTGVIPRNGYRIEKLRYESRPGVLATAHLYIPDGEGKFPIILRPHGHWPGKKAMPHLQASAIGLALSGFAVLAVDSPGHTGDLGPENERSAMGTHNDPFLSLGSPVFGVYVWDLMRGLDYLETRPEIDTKRVGITGASGGGQAATFAFALDSRIQVAVPVCSAGSLAVQPNNGCFCNHLPGLLKIGDRADILTMRSEDGALFVIGAEEDAEFPPESMRKTDERLRKAFRGSSGEGRYRFEIFPHGHDYNRRMREAALGFFRQHLQGQPTVVYWPEAIPLTDGAQNPAPANTVAFDDPELFVTALEQRSTRTLRELLAQSLAEPYPEPFEPLARLVPWGKYGKLPDIRPGGIVSIHDEGITPKEDDSTAMPFSEIDLRFAIYLGLSPAEVVAQILHLCLPGAPVGWEERGMTGDALTSLVASMRTLVSSSPNSPAPGMIVAEGPFASLVAEFLRRYRPDITVQATHPASSWAVSLESNNPALITPGARYLAF